ncbi:MAG: MBL fold metallo-hydrolase, partial [Gemmatimonadetes bacterium]|nr:MBL fold metallo-hydrolase [Gemmatimonadota bacterium]
MIDPDCSRRLPKPAAPSVGVGRRRFLGVAGGCLAHLVMLGAGGIPWRTRDSGVGGVLRAQEPWGSLVEIADGVWAMISNPMADRTTLCNGGIVAGRSGVAVIEAFASTRGAEWMADQALRLTGRRPDVVVVSHYHGDHSAGLPGFGVDESAPEVWLTGATRNRLTEGLREAAPERADPMARALERAVARPDDEDDTLDLGGRRVRIGARRGHTASDVTVELGAPPVVFCGDLVW